MHRYRLGRTSPPLVPHTHTPPTLPPSQFPPMSQCGQSSRKSTSTIWDAGSPSCAKRLASLHHRSAIFVSFTTKCNNCTLVTTSPSPPLPLSPSSTYTHKVTWVSDTGGLLNGHCDGPSLSEVFGEASLDYSDFPFTRGRTPSLVPRLRAPPGEKRSGERSRIPWAYYPKRVMTNEIARSVIIT